MTATTTTTTTMLFSPLAIGKLEMKNRTMRSATWEGLADSAGAATDVLINEMVKLADGNVGLVMLSHGYVEERGKAGPGQICLAKDETVSTYRALVDKIKAKDPRTLIGVQLAHAGVAAMVRPGIGPSAFSLVTKEGEPKPREMTLEDIDQLVQSFSDAAFRCKTLMGADVFQLHAAHGYLLSQFLSPLVNKRTDDYGGSIENRARVLLRIVAAIRERIGIDAVLAVKMNIEDFVQGGFTLEESTQVVLMLAKAGVTLFEASGGVPPKPLTIRPGKPKVEDEGYHKEGSKAWKKALVDAGYTSCVVAMVGWNRTGTQGNKLICEGDCDVISMSRSLIREPDLVHKWETLGLDYTAACVSCNLCFKEMLGGAPYGCAVDRHIAEKQKAPQ